VSPRPLILDGEVVVFDERLVSWFDLHGETSPDIVATPPIFMAFCCLYLLGREPEVFRSVASDRRDPEVLDRLSAIGERRRQRISAVGGPARGVGHPRHLVRPIVSVEGRAWFEVLRADVVVGARDENERGCHHRFNPHCSTSFFDSPAVFFDSGGGVPRRS
jgi:hypothetical protein